MSSVNALDATPRADGANRVSAVLLQQPSPTSSDPLLANDPSRLPSNVPSEDGFMIIPPDAPVELPPAWVTSNPNPTVQQQAEYLAQGPQGLIEDLESKGAVADADDPKVQRIFGKQMAQVTLDFSTPQAVSATRQKIEDAAALALIGARKYPSRDSVDQLVSAYMPRLPVVTSAPLAEVKRPGKAWRAEPDAPQNGLFPPPAARQRETSAEPSAPVDDRYDSTLPTTYEAARVILQYAPLIDALVAANQPASVSALILPLLGDYGAKFQQTVLTARDAPAEWARFKDAARVLLDNAPKKVPITERKQREVKEQDPNLYGNGPMSTARESYIAKSAAQPDDIRDMIDGFLPPYVPEALSESAVAMRTTDNGLEPVELKVKTSDKPITSVDKLYPQIEGDVVKVSSQVFDVESELSQSLDRLMDMMNEARSENPDWSDARSLDYALASLSGLRDAAARDKVYEDPFRKGLEYLIRSSPDRYAAIASLGATLDSLENLQTARPRFISPTLVRLLDLALMAADDKRSNSWAPQWLAEQSAEAALGNRILAKYLQLMSPPRMRIEAKRSNGRALYQYWRQERQLNNARLLQHMLDFGLLGGSKLPEAVSVPPPEKPGSDGEMKVAGQYLQTKVPASNVRPQLGAMNVDNVSSNQHTAVVSERKTEVAFQDTMAVSATGKGSPETVLLYDVNAALNAISPAIQPGDMRSPARGATWADWAENCASYVTVGTYNHTVAATGGYDVRAYAEVGDMVDTYPYSVTKRDASGPWISGSTWECSVLANGSGGPAVHVAGEALRSVLFNLGASELVNYTSLFRQFGWRLDGQLIPLVATKLYGMLNGAEGRSSALMLTKAMLMALCRVCSSMSGGLEVHTWLGDQTTSNVVPTRGVTNWFPSTRNIAALTTNAIAIDLPTFYKMTLQSDYTAALADYTPTKSTIIPVKSIWSVNGTTGMWTYVACHLDYPVKDTSDIFYTGIALGPAVAGLNNRHRMLANNVNIREPNMSIPVANTLRITFVLIDVNSSAEQASFSIYNAVGAVTNIPLYTGVGAVAPVDISAWMGNGVTAYDCTNANRAASLAESDGSFKILAELGYTSVVDVRAASIMVADMTRMSRFSTFQSGNAATESEWTGVGAAVAQGPEPADWPLAGNGGLDRALSTLVRGLGEPVQYNPAAIQRQLSWSVPSMHPVLEVSIAAGFVEYLATAIWKPTAEQIWANNANLGLHLHALADSLLKRNWPFDLATYIDSNGGTPATARSPAVMSFRQAWRGITNECVRRLLGTRGYTMCGADTTTSAWASLWLRAGAGTAPVMYAPVTLLPFCTLAVLQSRQLPVPYQSGVIDAENEKNLVVTGAMTRAAPGGVNTMILMWQDKCNIIPQDGSEPSQLYSEQLIFHLATRQAGGNGISFMGDNRFAPLVVPATVRKRYPRSSEALVFGNILRFTQYVFPTVGALEPHSFWSCKLSIDDLQQLMAVSNDGNFSNTLWYLKAETRWTIASTAISKFSTGTSNTRVVDYAKSLTVLSN